MIRIMKTSIFLILILSVCFIWADYPSGYFYAIFRGDTFCVYPVITDSITEASWFDYSSASMHTGFETEYESHFFFFYNPLTGNIGMVIQHNIDEGGTADATCVLYLDGLPSGSTLAMSDDAGEFDLSAYPQGNWHWWDNTDGGALYIPRSEWQYTIRFTFGSTDPIRSYWFISGDDGSDRIYLDTVYIDQEDTLIVGHGFLQLLTFIDEADFDSVNLGDVDTFHYPICNSDETIDTLRIGSMSLSYPEVFSMLSAPAELGPGECDDIILLFHPPDTGTFYDTLVIHANTPCDSVTYVPLVGRAIQPRIDTVWFSEETDCDGQNIVEVCYVLYGEPNTPLSVQLDFSPDDTSDIWFFFDDYTTEDDSSDWGDSIYPGLHCFSWHLDEDWMTEIPIARVRAGIVFPIDTFAVIDSISSSCTIGLGWDGEYLVGISGSRQICKIDTATGEHIDCFTLPHFNNGDAAITPDGKIYYTDYSTSPPYYEAIWWTDFSTHSENYFYSDSSDSFPCLADPTYKCSFQGLCTDGEFLWSVDSYGWMRKFEMSTGEIVDTFHIPYFVSDSALETRSDGLAYVEPYIFISDNSANIYKYDPEAHTIIRHYYAPPTASSTGPEGLAYDGEYLWYQDYSRGKIYKIQLLTVVGSQFIAYAPLDSKSPDVAVECPVDTIFYGDTAVFSWDISDMFPNASEDCSVFVNYCEGVDTFLLGAEDSLVWTSPLVQCDSAFIKIAAPDSFCNWGYDSCSFMIIAAGWLAVSFPETIVPPCETIDIPITIDSMMVPFTSELELVVVVNNRIITPISFVPEISPVPDSVGFIMSEDRIFIILHWDSRQILSGDILGHITALVNCDADGGEFTVLNIDTVAADLVEVYYTDGLLMVDYSPQEWMQFLRFDDFTEPKQDETALSFGNSSTGCDDYDEIHDLLYLPPPPDKIDAWFVMDDPDYPAVTKLERDMRDMTPINVWYAVINEDESLYVHWNPSYFDEGVYMLNGFQDMRADTDYYAAPYETLVITWDLPAFSVDTVNYSEGWNLVSLPTQNPGDDPSTIFFGAFAGPYGYNPITGAYYIAPNVQTGVGYWIYYDETLQMPSVGVPVERYGTTVYPGWNLVGATASPVPAGEIGVSPPTTIFEIFGYDPESGSYFHADTLFSGSGYWILINEGGVLWVPEEE
ncbi:hypothetical protein J7M00_00425 [bacterium]|nr:hypothetical protein [bacterium]